MKKILLSAFLACLSTIIYASNATILKVILQDNTSIACAFSKKPVMKFSNGSMELTTTDGKVGSWEFSKVKSWVFEEGTTDVETISVKNANDKEITIFDLSGKLIRKQNSDEKVNLQGLKAGIYIVKTGEHAVKISVRN